MMGQPSISTNASCKFAKSACSSQKIRRSAMIVAPSSTMLARLVKIVVPALRTNRCAVAHRSFCTPSSSSGGGSSNDAAEMAENVFHELAERELEVLQDAFEALEDDLEDMDVTNSQGVLTADLGDDTGTWVINKQVPNRQIWWSSPIRSARHRTACVITPRVRPPAASCTRPRSPRLEILHHLMTNSFLLLQRPEALRVAGGDKDMGWLARQIRGSAHAAERRGTTSRRSRHRVPRHLNAICSKVEIDGPHSWSEYTTREISI